MSRIIIIAGLITLATALSLPSYYPVHFDHYPENAPQFILPEYKSPNVHVIHANDPAKPAEDPQTLKRATRDPYPNGGFTFYENFFEAGLTGSLYIVWNNDNDQNVLVFVNFKAFLSWDGARTFTDLTTTLDGARDRQKADYDNYPYTGIRDFVETSSSSVLYLLGFGPILWVTEDAGKTFTRIDLPIYPRVPLGSSGKPLLVHPTQPNWLLAVHVPSTCFKGNPTKIICSQELWLSQDQGRSWRQLTTHVIQFFWDYDGDTDPNDDSIFVQAWQNKQIDQVQYVSYGILGSYLRIFQGREGSTQDLQEYTLGQNGFVTLAKNVYQTVIAGPYMFNVRPNANNADIIEIWVSLRGHDFGLASFATDHELGYLFIHDVADGAVILVERPLQATTQYISGTMWISDKLGLVYSEALPTVVFLSTSWVQRYALHKIRSLEASHLATIVENNQLRSLITWDKGGYWDPVRTQAALDGTFDDTNYPLIFFGATHSFTYASHRGFYSEPSAPGLILAAGAENITLADYEAGVKDGDMYFSRNGGLSFKKVLGGTNYCRFIDEGAAIFCVPGYEATTKLLYTLDEANTDFIEVQFSPTPQDIQLILSDPNSLGTMLMVAGVGTNPTTNTRQFMLVVADAGDVLPRVCDASDYELWTPNDGRLKGRCILGRKMAFQRIKAGAHCESKVNEITKVTVNCPCELLDFECDFGYKYDEDAQTCVSVASLANVTEIGPGDGNNAEVVCKNGFFSNPSGYRLIPGDQCDKTLPTSTDWSAPIVTECPVDVDLVNLATILGVTISVLVLIVVGFALFIWWKRKALYASYRNLPTNETVGLSESGLGAPDRFVDDDEEDDAQQIEAAFDATKGNVQGSIQL